MSDEKPTKIICSICKTEFECGANTHDCWCAKLPLVMPVKGDSCWCPTCLAEKLKERQGQ